MPDPIACNAAGAKGRRCELEVGHRGDHLATVHSAELYAVEGWPSDILVEYAELTWHEHGTAVLRVELSYS